MSLYEEQYKELVNLLDSVGVLQDDSPWAEEIQQMIKDHKSEHNRVPVKPSPPKLPPVRRIVNERVINQDEIDYGSDN
jgi:hypothetical protein